MVTLKQLKALCKKYKLTTSGTKKQLGKRLYNLRSDTMSKEDLKIIKDFLKVKTHKRKLKRTKKKSKNRSKNRSKAGLPGLTSILSFLHDGENRENHQGTQLAHGYQPTNEQIEQMRLMRQSMKNGIKPYPQQPFRDMRASDVPLTIQEEQSVDTGPRVDNEIVIHHNPIFNGNMDIIMKLIGRIKSKNDDIIKPVYDNDEFKEYDGHIDKFKNLHLVVNLPDGQYIHVPLTYKEYEELDSSKLFEYLPKGRIISREKTSNINGYDNEEKNYSIKTEFMEGITERPCKSIEAIKKILGEESLGHSNLDVVRIYRAIPNNYDSAAEKYEGYKVQSLKVVSF
jgi:hypothetical protein